MTPQEIWDYMSPGVRAARLNNQTLVAGEVPGGSLTKTGIIGAISGASFGAAYVGSMRTTWDSYSAATAVPKPSPTPTNIPSLSYGINQSYFTPLYGSDYEQGMTRKELLTDNFKAIAASQVASQVASSELPEGATVLPSGLVSYHGKVYEAQMPKNYAEVSMNTPEVGKGPFLYKYYNTYGLYDWPSFFFGKNRYASRGVDNRM